MLDRGVEPEGLQDAQVYRRHRSELAFPPAMSRRPTGRLDGLFGQMEVQILFETMQRAKGRGHPRLFVSGKSTRHDCDRRDAKARMM